MKLLLDLFLTFARIGLFTFGGGYAMISLIERECVENSQWITHDDMMNVTVIAESTPGPIAINCATFVGYRQKGMAGAVSATLGMILPSFVIIYLISRVLERYLEIGWVAGAFRGIRLAVGLLIVDAAVKMIRKMQKKPLPRAFLAFGCAAVVIAGLLSFRVSSVVLMLLAGAVSMGIFAAGGGPKKGGAGK